MIPHRCFAAKTHRADEAKPRHGSIDSSAAQSVLHHKKHSWIVRRLDALAEIKEELLHVDALDVGAVYVVEIEVASCDLAHHVRGGSWLNLIAVVHFSKIIPFSKKGI